MFTLFILSGFPSSVEKANDLKKAMDTQKSAAGMDLAVPRLPDIDETHFPLVISYVSSFLVQDFLFLTRNTNYLYLYIE